MAAQEAVTRDQIREALIQRVKEADSSEFILTPVNTLDYYLYEKKGIDVSNQTIRNKGFCPNGYFVKFYRNVDWIASNGEKSGALIEDREKFLEEVREKHDGKFA